MQVGVPELKVFMVFVGKCRSEEAFGQALVFVLKTTEDYETRNDPKDAWITAVHQLFELGILLPRCLDNRTECNDLLLFFRVEEVSFPLLPRVLIFLKSQHQFRVIL